MPRSAEDLGQRAKETGDELEAAHEETNRIRARYVATGPGGPDGRVTWPERILDADGIRQIEQAEKCEQEKWDAHQEAIRRLVGGAATT